MSSRIKEIRELRGYTQQDLAEQLGVTKQQVYRWEIGKNTPAGDVIAKIAKILEVTSDYLLGLVDEPDTRLSERDLSKEEWRILQAFRNGDFKKLILVAAEEMPEAKK